MCDKLVFPFRKYTDGEINTKNPWQPLIKQLDVPWHKQFHAKAV